MCTYFFFAVTILVFYIIYFMCCACALNVCCFLQPFVDEVHPLQSLFLPRVYALLIPIVAGIVAMIGLGTNWSDIFVFFPRYMYLLLVEDRVARFFWNYGTNHMRKVAQNRPISISHLSSESSPKQTLKQNETLSAITIEHISQQTMSGRVAVYFTYLA